MKTVGLLLHTETSQAAPMRVLLDPPISPDAIEIDLTEFAVEDDEPVQDFGPIGVSWARRAGWY